MYTVVMAVHNGERFVSAALESILKQSLPPYQVIVVNDSSIDSTEHLLRSFGTKICLLDCQAKSQSAALNIGITHATSEYVAFLDHDDLWVKDKQAEQIQALTESGADCVVGGVSNFNSQEEQTYLGPARVFGATTFRRKAFERVGLLDETIKHHAIFDWWSRAKEQDIYDIQMDREHLLRRIHEDNSGITKRSEARSAMIREVRAHLRRNI